MDRRQLYDLMAFIGRKAAEGSPRPNRHGLVQQWAEAQGLAVDEVLELFRAFIAQSRKIGNADAVAMGEAFMAELME